MFNYELNEFKLNIQIRPKTKFLIVCLTMLDLVFFNKVLSYPKIHLALNLSRKLGGNINQIII